MTCTDTTSTTRLDDSLEGRPQPGTLFYIWAIFEGDKLIQSYTTKEKAQRNKLPHQRVVILEVA